MIPSDRDELYALAGEYVLGVLEDAPRREIEAALARDAALARAVAFWEERLHGLSQLAPPAEPPPGLWNRVAARLDTPGIAPSAAPPGPLPTATIVPLRPRNSAVPWRWATGALAAIAACLALYIGVAPRPEAPRYLAVLHAPQASEPAWVATAGRSGMRLQQVAALAAPNDRAFELWVIPRGAKTPQPLGVIPPNGRLHLGNRPAPVEEGGTLAISVEPPGGSPSGQPTGPVVFVGLVVRAD